MNYLLSYKYLDFEFSFSLWCSDKKNADTKEFKELVDEIFRAAKTRES